MARSGALALWLILPAAGLLTAPVAADPVADFYRGKTVSVIIATSPGGDYDARGRLLARHLGRHIPGQPTLVARNMPGAVGIQAANCLANVAPRDGTVLHMIMQNMPTHQALGGANVEFDVRRFPWIGGTTQSPNVVNSWHTTGIRIIEDVKTRELVVGAPGTATASVYYPRVMNAVIGTKFKIITGYPGGNHVNLAMERGEVGGRGSNSWASWKSTRPQWIAEKRIHILVQVGPRRHPELADVPLLTELTNNDADRAVMQFMSGDIVLSRAMVTTPETPPERVAALRKAFQATLQDPQFLAEAAQAKIDISQVDDNEAQRAAAAIIDTPAEVLARTKALLESPTK